jgi:hypothetical protein
MSISKASPAFALLVVHAVCVQSSLVFDTMDIFLQTTC